MAFFKPVLPYKLTFDCSKGKKNKMEIHYTRTEETGEVAQEKILKTSAKCCICESTKPDETLWTWDKFNRVWKTTKMSWKDAHQHFLNCFGETPSMRLERSGPSSAAKTKDRITLKTKQDSEL